MVIAESEPINLNAYNSLDLLASAGYIEKGAVKRAREIGGLAANTGLTIGFELEVTGGSIVDLPNRLDPDAAKQLCKQFGFNHSYDEEYEVIMPPANHPYIAQLLLHGAIRNGLIPAETDGIVSSHINIGNIVTPTYQSETLFNLILITRAIEQIGGSSPERLLSPIGTHSKNPDSSPIHSWNCRSTGGIDWAISAKDNENWVGESSRIEFRSMQYKNPSQHAVVADGIYYLSQGLFDTEHVSHRLFMQFRNDFIEFCADRNIAPMWADGVFASIDEKWKIDGTVASFTAYMEPFARTINPENAVLLFSFIRRTVLAIRESYNLDSVPTRFEDTSLNSALTA